VVFGAIWCYGDLVANKNEGEQVEAINGRKGCGFLCGSLRFFVKLGV